MDHLIIPLLNGTLVAATPLIFAAIGELITERSGVMNLGIEGMMLIGAASAFGVALGGHPAYIAALVAMLAAMVAASLFAILALGLAVNQYAAGLALTILGSGLSAVIGRQFQASSVTSIQKLHIPGLSDLPWVGKVVFSQDPLVYLALALAGLAWWFLYRTRAGLVLRAVGEAPHSARAIGYPVIRIRYCAIMFGGAMAGLAGAYLSLAYTPLWVDEMTAGRGWIALALVVFATWRPGRVVLGAWLFGGVTVAQLFAQTFGLHVPTQFMSALPYVATIVVLVLISRNPQTLRLNTPLSLAQPFRPDR
jgi:general nucleoside transport system permease protein